MAEVKEKEETKVELVEMYNQGQTPHVTSVGMLMPNNSVLVPALEASRLGAYSYIVPASKILKTSAGNDKLKAENTQLNLQIEELNKQVEALQGKVTDFLGASKLAELKGLQEKHAPAEAEPVAA